MKIAVMILVFASLGLLSSNGLAKHGGGGLPPGLAKNAERGKPLPPGWQKKLSKGDVLDNDIYARGRVVVPLGKDGSITIEIDSTLIKLEANTRKILDIR